MSYHTPHHEHGHHSSKSHISGNDTLARPTTHLVHRQFKDAHTGVRGFLHGNTQTMQSHRRGTRCLAMHIPKGGVTRKGNRVAGLRPHMPPHNEWQGRVHTVVDTLGTDTMPHMNDALQQSPRQQPSPCTGPITITNYRVSHIMYHTHPCHHGELNHHLTSMGLSNTEVLARGMSLH